LPTPPGTAKLVLPPRREWLLAAIASPVRDPDYGASTTPCGVVQLGGGRPVTWTVDYGGANCNNSNVIIGYQHAEALGS
jgi:hypothetical protein